MTGEYLGENGLAHNVHVKNDLVYISHYSVGIKIIDVLILLTPLKLQHMIHTLKIMGLGMLGAGERIHLPTIT